MNSAKSWSSCDGVYLWLWTSGEEYRRLAEDNSWIVVASCEHSQQQGMGESRHAPAPHMIPGYCLPGQLHSTENPELKSGLTSVTSTFALSIECVI